MNCKCEHENACNRYGGESLCHCCFLIKVGIASKDTWVAGKACATVYCNKEYQIPLAGFVQDDGGNGKTRK